VIGSRFDERQLRCFTLKTLGTLTFDEKQFLRPFIINGENTVNAPISDGVSGGLVAKRIVYRSSNVFYGFNAPFNLQPMARRLLTEKPRLD
jgi:hypothetical protein